MGDFVGREERVRGDRRLWGFSAAAVGGKRGIRGLIKVTSECFILSKPASSTGNTLRGFAERGSGARCVVGGGSESSLWCLSQYKPEATRDSGVRPPLYKSPPERRHNKGHSAGCNIAQREFPGKKNKKNNLIYAGEELKVICKQQFSKIIYPRLT